MKTFRFRGLTQQEVQAQIDALLGNSITILSSKRVDGFLEVLVVPDSNNEDTLESIPAIFRKRHAVEVPYTPLDAAGLIPMQAELQRIREELHGVRAVLDTRSGKSDSRPPAEELTKNKWSHKLLSAGFSPWLTKYVVTRMPIHYSEAQLEQWVMMSLQRNLSASGHVDTLLERGGIYALVGPTGVGKTTTTAKLAARAVVRYGANQVAMITTDNYRIGAVDQLKEYGKILGIPVLAIHDGITMKKALGYLSDRKLILMDTVGMSQRDQRVADQLALLNEGGAVSRVLLLNAVTGGETLEDVVRGYRGSTPNLVGCILTKLDETRKLAPALDVIIRHQLPIFYVTNGQKVPEDVHAPNTKYLVHRALHPTPSSKAFAWDEDTVRGRI